MRLSDAGLRRRQTKPLYPNHRSPPWPTEDATRRSLEPIVRLLLLRRQCLVLLHNLRYCASRLVACASSRIFRAMLRPNPDQHGNRRDLRWP